MRCKLSTSRMAGNGNAISPKVMTSDALQDTAGELFGINRGAMDGSMQLIKRELSSNGCAELLQLVQVQLKSTMEGLHCLDNLKCFLTKLGRDVVLPFLAGGTNGVEVMLQKVKEFKAMGDKAAMRLTLEDYEQAFSSQLSVLRELQLRRNRLDHKLSKVKAWRKAWSIVYSTVKFGVIVLSVVLAVLTAPPAATATANGTGGVMALLQQWVDSKWDYYQSSCEAERELTGKILNEASLTFHGFNNVGVLLRRLEVQIASMTHHGEFAINEDDEDTAARMAVEMMKPKAADVMASVESLEKEVDRRREELRRTALTILQSVTDQVGNSDNGEGNIPVGYENQTYCCFTC